jgi:8-oxo-dGTP diphosphatase
MLYIIRHMLRRILGALWRGAPTRLRRFGVRLIEPRFTVSAGAVVVDEQGRVLLLKHVFRMGSGWGIPGGFLEKGEQPDEAIRRELREEVGLELASAEIALVRTLKKSKHMEIIFLCRPRGEAKPRSTEIKTASWHALDRLPPQLDRDQRHLIKRAFDHGANARD